MQSEIIENIKQDVLNYEYEHTVDLQLSDPHLFKIKYFSTCVCKFQHRYLICYHISGTLRYGIIKMCG